MANVNRPKDFPSPEPEFDPWLLPFLRDQLRHLPGNVDPTRPESYYGYIRPWGYSEQFPHHESIYPSSSLRKDPIADPKNITSKQLNSPYRDPFPEMRLESARGRLEGLLARRAVLDDQIRETQSEISRLEAEIDPHGVKRYKQLFDH